MDAVVQFSNYVEGEMLPHISKQMNCLYTINMVLLAVKSKDYSWHKENWFTSYIRAILFAVGVDVIIALFTGKPAFEPMAKNPTILIATIAWWLLLFVPYDIFNKVIYLKVGEIQPFHLIIVWFALAHRIVRMSNVMKTAIGLYSHSYAVVFLGIIAGNGTVVVAPVFGEFAICLGDHIKYCVAVMTSVAFALFGFGYLGSVAHSVVLTFCLVVASFAELTQAMGKDGDIFHPFSDFLRRIVVTKELVKNKSD